MTTLNNAERATSRAQALQSPQIATPAASGALVLRPDVASAQLTSPQVEHLLGLAAAQFVHALDTRLAALFPLNAPPAPSAPSMNASPAPGPHPTRLPTAAGSNAIPGPQRTIHIHGNAVTIQYTEIPDPPAVPLGSDIQMLAAHWGDISTEWDEVKSSAYLHIGAAAVPIPMQSWRAVYSGWSRLNDRRWRGAKGPWQERKVRITQLRRVAR